MKKGLLVALVVLLLIALYNMFSPPARSTQAEYVSVGILMNEIRQQPERVKWLRVTDTRWRGEWADGRPFHTLGPKLDGALLKELQGIPVDVSDDDLLALLIGTWAPMLVLVGMFYWFMRRATRPRLDLEARVAELEAELALIKRG